VSYELRSEVWIDAPVETVWEVLTDTASYPDWNPLVRRFDGPLEVGAVVRATFEPFPGLRLRNRIAVTALSPPHRVAWAGRMGANRLLRGEHVYELAPRDGGTQFANFEVFDGWLLPIARLPLERTRAGYDRNSEAIKVRAEER
jgi:hypothetical protein